MEEPCKTSCFTLIPAVFGSLYELLLGQMPRVLHDEPRALLRHLLGRLPLWAPGLTLEVHGPRD